MLRKMSTMFGDDAVSNEVNSNFQHRCGIELITKIANQDKHTKFDIAVDIGCGKGHVTIALTRELYLKRVYAIDNDSVRVAFAKQNNASDYIKYLVHDINSDWNDWSEELKKLENRVSLIYSNFDLNWLELKENVAKNLSRLLAPNGVIYSNIAIISNPFLEMSAKERAVHEQKYIHVPEPDEQMRVWKSVFTRNQLIAKQSDKIYDNAYFDLDKFKSLIIPMYVSAFRQFITSKDEKERDEIANHLTAFLMDNQNTQRDNNLFKFIFDENDKKIVEFSFIYYRFVLKKNRI